MWTWRGNLQVIVSATHGFLAVGAGGLGDTQAQLLTAVSVLGQIEMGNKHSHLALNVKNRNTAHPWSSEMLSDPLCYSSTFVFLLLNNVGIHSHVHVL